MSYARKYEEFERRGAQVVGISVDPPPNGAAMVEKLNLPFSMLTDPQGELSRRYDVWNAQERIAIPAIFVVDQTGGIAYVYRGRDFADRPGDKPMFDALDRVGGAVGRVGSQLLEPEVRVSPQEAEHSVRSDRHPISLDHLSVYYRGVYFASVALKQRIAALGPAGREAFREVSQYQTMVTEYRHALEETVKLKRG